jgi:hypothetical protein
VLHLKSAAMDGRFWTSLFAMLEEQVNEGLSGDPGGIAKATASSAMAVRIERP